MCLGLISLEYISDVLVDDRRFANVLITNNDYFEHFGARFVISVAALHGICFLRSFSTLVEESLRVNTWFLLEIGLLFDILPLYFLYRFATQALAIEAHIKDRLGVFFHALLHLLEI